MTVQSTISRTDVVASAGATVINLTFFFEEDSHLQVYKNLELQTTGYTPEGAGRDTPLGTVTFIAPLEEDDKIAVIRVVPVTQLADYELSGRFPSEVTEDSLDKLTFIDQQQEEELARCIKFDPASTSADLLLEDPSTENVGHALQLEEPQPGVFRWGYSEGVVDDIVDDAESARDAAQASAQVSQSARDEIVDLFITPEMFGAVGDGVADDTAALNTAFSEAENGTITLAGGKTYTHTGVVIVPPNCNIIATGSTLKKTSATMGPGHFIQMNGDKSDLLNPVTLNNISWEGGTVDVDSNAGINGFGIEVVDGITLKNVTVENCVHDPAAEGGRGYTTHRRSRNVNYVNCRAINCSHGFDESWVSDTLKSVSITGATSTNPIVITSANHGFTNGQNVHIQQMRGDFIALNGQEFVITSATTNTFTLTGANGAGFSAYTSNGIATLADTGQGRLRNISMIGCIAESCPVSALTLIQANNSRDLSLKSADFFVQGFKAFNCGTQYTSQWGVINSSASVGVHGDIQVYNDESHPVGAVFRGSMHKWSIDAIVDVHTCDSLVDSTPLVSVDGLDGGVGSHPEGTMQECAFNILFANEVLNEAVVRADVSSLNPYNYMFRNIFDIRLTRKDYTSIAPFAGVLVENVTDSSNFAKFSDLFSSRSVSFFFDKPISFINSGIVLSEVTIDGSANSRADLRINTGGSSVGARISALDGSTTLGYLEYSKADNRWRINNNTNITWQITASNIIPNNDNVRDLGSAGLRMRTIYAGTGTINTSDEREKQQVRLINEAEKRAAVKCKCLLRAFKFNDAVESKGNGARTHFGVIAQDVKEALESEGLNAFEYAFLCYDEWKDETAGEIRNRYGIRYEELLAFIISAM